MRVFLTVLVLIFSLQSWTKAEDISDFEIEGIGIGDSLLDFFSINEIESRIVKEYYKYKSDKKFVAAEFYDKPFFEIYKDGIQIHIKIKIKRIKQFT